MQFFRRPFFRFLLSLALALPAAAVLAQPKGAAAGSYTGAITIDALTGAVLFEENADVSNPPASMTKLMTFAVLHDRLREGSLSLDTAVQITPADAKMGGTQVYLDPREVFSVEELIYAMMIQSANDAAHALARVAGGSVPAFVELMNAKAQQLGMHNTVFRTPHGLPAPSRRIDEGDQSTPRDFAVLSRHLVQRTDILKYTSVRERAFGPARAQGPMMMRNHNNLLGKVAGADGLKTGYTQAAGYCLSATAERNGRRVIVVIMGALGPNRQIDRGRSRDLKVIELLERGFASAAPLPTVSTPSPTVSGAKPTTPPAPKTGPAASSRNAPAKAAFTEEIPTVKTQPPAAPKDEASTQDSPTVIFRLPPAPKS